jgi:hypothetical protein
VSDESTPIDERADPPEEGGDRQNVKKAWKRARRVGYVLGVLVLVPVVAFAVVYQVVDVPDAAAVAAEQSKVVTVHHSDGTEMVKIAEPGLFDSGSGLTHQCVRLVSGNDSPTLTRKISELVRSYKANNRLTKEEIVTGYLNTVYFGRGAHGISSAAQAYFAKGVEELTPSEAALLAGLIQGPSRSEDDRYAAARWGFVMDQMLTQGWIDKGYRDSQKFPAPRPTEEAKSAAVDVKTGAVRAYWAGRDGSGVDQAAGTLQEPGSAFTPFDLVAALQKGKGARVGVRRHVTARVRRPDGQEDLRRVVRRPVHAAQGHRVVHEHGVLRPGAQRGRDAGGGRCRARRGHPRAGGHQRYVPPAPRR